MLHLCYLGMGECKWVMKISTDPAKGRSCNRNRQAPHIYRNSLALFLFFYWFKKVINNATYDFLKGYRKEKRMCIQ